MKRAESQSVSRRAARAARGHARLAAKRGDELWPSNPNAHLWELENATADC
jgi:hypothetical protein